MRSAAGSLARSTMALGQELAAAKMILDGILSKDSSAYDAAGGRRRERIGGPRDQASSHDFPSSAPSSCWTRSGWSRLFAGTWKGFPNAAESRFAWRSIRPISAASSPNGNRHLPHHPGGADQHVPAFGAHKGCVTLIENEGRIVVTVSDDGKGIEEQVIQLRPDSVGVGIGGMRQRVNELGGSLRLANANPGTIVEVVIPCRRHEPLRVPVTA